MEIWFIKNKNKESIVGKNVGKKCICNTCSNSNSKSSSICWFLYCCSFMSFTFILFQCNKFIIKKNKHVKLQLFCVANIVLLKNIPQFIIQIYYITTTSSEHFTENDVIQLCFSVLPIIGRTNRCLSQIKMTSSSKYTASVCGSITTKCEQEIGNNIMKRINAKNYKDKKPTANATTPSGTHGTNCASLVSVSISSNHSSHHNNYHSDSREIRYVRLFCNKRIAHCMDYAVKFKLSDDLDRYQTLISSEVHFVESFPATSSLRVHYEFRFFSNIDDVITDEDFTRCIPTINAVTWMKRIRVMIIVIRRKRKATMICLNNNSKDSDVYRHFVQQQECGWKITTTSFVLSIFLFFLLVFVDLKKIQCFVNIINVN